MRIVIDYQGAQNSSRHRGIGRYTTSLVDALIKNNTEHEIIILLSNLFPETIDSINEHFASLNPAIEVVVWRAFAPAAQLDDSAKDKRIVAEYMREATIASLKPDLVLITSLLDCLHDDTVSLIRKGRDYLTALIFYDAIPLLQQEIYLKPNPHFEKVYLNKIREILNADILFAISESARQEAISCLNYPDRQSFNIGAGVSNCFQKIDVAEEVRREVLKKFGIDRPFIMYSGASDERKNHSGLIQAFSKLKTEGFSGVQLALVGGLPDENRKKFRDIANNLNLSEKEVIITGQVSDDELIALYNLCKLFVFPSLHEGFGLPALEAMSCGAPVIGSNSTSIPEILGNSDLLFDPSSPENMASAIKEILSDDEYRNIVAAYCLKRSKNFSWDLAAKALLEGIKKCCHVTRNSTVPTETSYQAADKFDSIHASIASLASSEQSLILDYITEMGINRKHKLFVDISELIHRDARSGIQRVVKNIYREICNADLAHYDVIPVYALNDGKGYLVSFNFNSHFVCDEISYPIISNLDEPLVYSDGDLFLGLDLQPEIVPLYKQSYADMRNNGVKVIFIVYDILSLTMPQYFPDGAEENFNKWFSTVAEVSDGLICISQDVARECSKWILDSNLLNGLKKIESWNLGADFISKQISNDSALDKSAFNAKFKKFKGQTNFLMVGTLEPRKGHRQILDAFEVLWSRNIAVNLIMVGKVGWNTESLVEKISNHPMSDTSLFWLNSICDTELEDVYSEATALIAGSFGEGYGLPIVEASQRGLPVLCRDIPVFREVAGEAAFYLKGSHPAENADEINQWIELYQQGLLNNSSKIEFLSWKESAQILIEKMEIFTSDNKIRDLALKNSRP
jgi:glycosyltransferase involved in cell wall biosynthesis